MVVSFFDVFMTLVTFGWWVIVLKIKDCKVKRRLRSGVSEVRKALIDMIDAAIAEIETEIKDGRITEAEGKKQIEQLRNNRKEAEKI